MFGSILQPDECWMLNSRLPTVALRMNRQSKNAQRLAEALNGHPSIEHVLYPSLFQDPEQRRIYEKQCAYPGGLFSVEFRAAARRPSTFCATCGSPGTPYRWAVWKRSPAIPRSQPTRE